MRTRMKFQTATLSHDDIRIQLWDLLDKAYAVRDENGSVSGWADLVDVYDSYVIARLTIGGVRGLYKLSYSIGADDVVALGEGPVAVEERYVVKDTMEMVATKVIAGDEAAALIDDLVKNNPLFAAIKGSPNTHFVVFDLTSVGSPSQHQGPIKYQLATAGLPKALPTLITKPIHVTPSFDAHIAAGKDPVAVGAFMGGIGIDNADGSVTLRAIGTLWDRDFPEVVEEIQARRAELGASYEIAYLAASASRLGPAVVEIGEYEFAGGAILLKTAAAHQETQILMAERDPGRTFDVMDEAMLAPLLAYLRGATSMTQAKRLTVEERNSLKDSDFALIQTVEDKRGGGTRKVRRFPIQDEAHRKNAWARLPNAKDLSDAERATVADKVMARAKREGDEWAKTYSKTNGKWIKKEGRMATMKYPGIPEELELIVDALIVNATKAATDATQAELATTQTSFAEMSEEMKKNQEKMKKDCEALAAAEVKVTELTAKLVTADAVIAEATKATEAAQLAAAIESTWAKLKADYGLKDGQRKEREALLVKMATGKDPLSLDEIKALTIGGKMATVIPLFAGAGAADAPDKAAIAKNFPAAGQVRFR